MCCEKLNCAVVLWLSCGGRYYTLKDRRRVYKVILDCEGTLYFRKENNSHSLIFHRCCMSEKN